MALAGVPVDTPWRKQELLLLAKVTNLVSLHVDFIFFFLHIH